MITPGGQDYTIQIVSAAYVYMMGKHSPLEDRQRNIKGRRLKWVYILKWKN
jgi:hypothetical protein